MDLRLDAGTIEQEDEQHAPILFVARRSVWDKVSGCVYSVASCPRPWLQF